MKEGWALPGLSRKSHYFVEGRSLCGRWAYFGDCYPDIERRRSPLDCVVCVRKLDRRQGKEAMDRPQLEG